MAFILRLLGLLVVFIILGSQNARGITVNCRDLFKNDVRLSAKKQLTTEVIQETIKSLAQLKLKLDLSHDFQSPVLSKLRLDYAQKEAEFLHLLETQGVMIKAQLISEISREIQELQVEQSQTKSTTDDEKRREEKKAIELSVVDGSRAIFHPMEPGEFEMGEMGRQKHVEITKPFAMMATQMTQVIWKIVAQTARKRFPNRFEALNEEPSGFKGDLNPVEQVSYNDIQLWLEGLNELAKADDPIISALMPGQIRGSIYRLPTEAEWEFVARSRGQAKGDYHFGINEANLKYNAWYRDNSGSTTHPVALKDPLNMDGKEFYDLYGNVWEWTADAYEIILPGGIDPLMVGDQGSERIIRGGSWNNIARGLYSTYRLGLAPTDRGNDLGFRLVRASP